MQTYRRTPVIVMVTVAVLASSYSVPRQHELSTSQIQIKIFLIRTDDDDDDDDDDERSGGRRIWRPAQFSTTESGHTTY